MRERLIELIQNSVKGCARHWAEIIADYLLANGVIVPPCKVGDVVYDLTFGEVNAYVVEKMNFTYTPNGLECVEVNAMGKYGLIFNFNNIGKTVFLSREEAEKALEGGKE